MKIIIIGYRGTGKTSVSKQLADELDLKYLSTDNLVVEKENATINETVKKKGWDYFRERETEVIEEIKELDNCVVDTGGGVIEDKRNIANLKQNSKIILLTADIKTIIQRIEGAADRPSLTKDKSFTEEVEEVLTKRMPLYLEAADAAIDTTRLTIPQVVQKIREYLKE